ncbi:hypothetical protein P692DRAFT_20723185, partial [Suillus brevipes Sb2]
MRARKTVLVCEEAPREDIDPSIRPKFPAIPIVTCVQASSDTIDIVDLYSVGHVETTKEQLETKEAVPFIHQITLEGPRGEAVRIRALFDDGAMVAAMCTSIFDKIKHRLDNWGPSERKLRMANGNIVNADAKWSGTIEINGIRAKGDFEVFNSGGGWAFLFGKPLLQSFKAEHDYKSDSIKIANDSQSTTICNQVAHLRALQRAEHGVSLTQDIKQ